MTHRRLKVLLVWIALIVAWEGAFRVIGWKPWLFPAPSHVFDATMNMLGLPTHFGEPLHAGWPWKIPDAEGDVGAAGPHTPLLLKAIVISGARLLIGFAISLMIGTFLGLVMWRWPFFDALWGPTFLGLQTLPSVCWVPLAVLMLGYSEATIMMVLILGSLPAIALAMRDGLRTIPPIYQRAGLMLGARKWRLYRHVLLPAGMPALASSLRQGFSFAWRSLMGAELILMLTNRGLGFLLQMGRDFADVAQVVAVMVIMVLIGMAVDRGIFAKIEHRVRRRFGLIAAT